jgi:hypothetical protein
MYLAYIHRLRSCSSSGGESSLAAILKSALPRSPLTANEPDDDRTLTLAKIPELKRKRLRWFATQLRVRGGKKEVDEDKRAGLKRKLEELGGSWTPPASLIVPANVSR